jgi:hypothetical protein
MRLLCRVVLPAALVTSVAGPAGARTQAQTTGAPAAVMTPLEIAVDCAPMPTLETPTGKVLRVIGAHDVVARSEFGNGDMLVLDGGSGAGVQPGQQYYVRHANRFGMYDSTKPPHQGARTGGWVLGTPSSQRPQRSIKGLLPRVRGFSGFCVDRRGARSQRDTPECYFLCVLCVQPALRSDVRCEVGNGATREFRMALKRRK